jgi:hypothetical protein
MLPQSVTVIYGMSELRCQVAGRTVGTVRHALRSLLNIPPEAVAITNGINVGDDYLLQPGDMVQFIKAQGAKGLGRLLTPEEVMACWQINQKQYEELLDKGLPTITFGDGGIRHPEMAVDEWFRRTPIQGSVQGDGAGQRLVINVKDHAATLDGEPVALKDQSHALFVQALVEAKGNWVSNTEICQAKPDLQGERLDRLRKALPRKLKALIEAKPGTGYRLRL